MPDGTEEIHEETFGSLDPMEFRACYPESKRMAETICQELLPPISGSVLCREDRSFLRPGHDHQQ